MFLGFPTRDKDGSSPAWWERRLARPHPDVFIAGVRAGAARWRFAPSAVDPLVTDGVVTMRHGKRQVRVRAAELAGAGSRAGHLRLVARDSRTGAPIELSVPEGDVVRFGVTL